MDRMDGTGRLGPFTAIASIVTEITEMEIPNDHRAVSHSNFQGRAAWMELNAPRQPCSRRGAASVDVLCRHGFDHRCNFGSNGGGRLARSLVHHERPRRRARANRSLLARQRKSKKAEEEGEEEDPAIEACSRLTWFAQEEESN